MPTHLLDPSGAEYLASVLAAIGATDSPAVLTLQVDDLEAAGERLLADGIGYRSTGGGITVSIGDSLSVEVTAADPTDYDITAERTGSSISVKLTSAPDSSGLRIPRRVYLNDGSDLHEQVQQLLRDQPPALRAQVLAAAREVAQ